MVKDWIAVDAKVFVVGHRWISVSTITKVTATQVEVDGTKYPLKTLTRNRGYESERIASIDDPKIRSEFYRQQVSALARKVTAAGTEFGRDATDENAAAIEAALEKWRSAKTRSVQFDASL